MIEKRIKHLLEKHKKGTLSNEEQGILDIWYLKLSQSETADIDKAEINKRLNDVWSNLEVNKKRSKNLLVRLGSAAAIFLIVSSGIILYTYKSNNQSGKVNSLVIDIAPGGNKAFLTLADGKRIVLNDAKNGELAQQSGVKITKAADGQLIYTVSNFPNENHNVNAYNTIETPRGGTYQVRLPDGTKVWLNAASTIKYPVSFSPQKERRITLLSGEAYFEVAKDKKHPFIVQTDQQEVKVLGTHFNIDSYTNEHIAKTTLLEGSIKVDLISPFLSGESRIIKPGQQLQIEGSRLAVIDDIDLEDVVSWKNGYFKFNENLEGIMYKLSRWYNVEIVFKTKPDSKRILQGEISRNRDLSEVLDMLRYTGNINFKIEGRRVMVTD